MLEWFESLTDLGRILAYIAIPATLIMFIQLVMMIVGMGSSGGGDTDTSDIDVDGIDLDGDGIPDDIGDGIYTSDTPHDFESDTQNDSGFRLFSFRTIIAFLAMFGWTGLLLQSKGVDTVLTLIFAFAAGFAVMMIIAFTFMWLLRLTSDGSMSIKNALGVSGSVYLRIPPERHGTGKVNVLVQETLHELSAVTDEKTTIEFGEEIVVVGISGQNTLIVKRK